MKNSDSKISVNPDIVFREVDGEGLLLEPATRSLHILNDTGLTFWNLIDNNITVGTLVERALEIYDVENDQLEHDVDVFLSKMVELHLIKLLAEEHS